MSAELFTEFRIQGIRRNFSCNSAEFYSTGKIPRNFLDGIPYEELRQNIIRYTQNSEIKGSVVPFIKHNKYHRPQGVSKNMRLVM